MQKKKMTKRLTLNRETLLQLGSQSMATAVGGGSVDVADTCPVSACLNSCKHTACC